MHSEAEVLGTFVGAIAVTTNSATRFERGKKWNTGDALGWLSGV
jgi:hypothetical protein